MIRLIKYLFIFLPLLFIGCAHNNNAINNCPDIQCKPQNVYKTVYVPVYKNPLDNVTIQEPSQLKLFQFSETGDICLDDTNFKILLQNLTILKGERDYYFKIIKEIKETK